MSSNMQRLGDTLSSRMKKTSAAAIPMLPELGTIGSNLSLNVDSLPDPIPKGDYMINLMLAGESYRTSSETHSHSGGSHSHSGTDHSHSGGSHSHDGGAHSHELPSAFRSPKEGDRVLVVWCGKEPVVIAVVVSS